MKLLNWGYQALVAFAVLAITYHYYAMLHGNAEGLPTLEPIIYYVVAAAVFVVPLFWAFTHLCGGLLFGIAAGGVMDGLKLGLILGLGLSVGKLWPYVAAAAVGTYLGQGPALYVWGGAALAVLLFALDKVMFYFWQSTTNRHE